MMFALGQDGWATFETYTGSDGQWKSCAADLSVLFNK